MIIESKATIDKILPYLPLRIGRAMAWLRDTDLSTLTDDRHEIEGDDIFVVISGYKTQKAEDCVTEAHFKYIDIQYIISGEELIYQSQLGAKSQKVIEKNVKEDFVTFESDIAEENCYHLRTGQIAIFFPWDVHRTKARAGKATAKVRKAVIKVRAEG